MLIDALDEADPPEEQRANFDSTKATVKACGNRLLSLLVSIATQLGPNIKVIITTRPEACCGGIKAVIERTFRRGGGTVFLAPRDVRSRPGSVTRAPSDLPPSRDGSGSGGHEPVLVYGAVYKECELSGSHLPAPEGGAATLDNLYAAYRLTFERQPPSGKALILLQVILAAQEPLSTSLLQQLDLGPDVLRSLPGYGCLFYETEHRIYMLHKSLSDWLLEGNDASIAPDVTAGHRDLGSHLLKEALRASAASPPSGEYAWERQAKARCCLLLNVLTPGGLQTIASSTARCTCARAGRSARGCWTLRSGAGTTSGAARRWWHHWGDGTTLNRDRPTPAPPSQSGIQRGARREDAHSARHPHRRGTRQRLCAGRLPVARSLLQRL